MPRFKVNAHFASRLRAEEFTAGETIVVPDDLMDLYAPLVARGYLSPMDEPARYRPPVAAVLKAQAAQTVDARHAARSEADAARDTTLSSTTRDLVTAAEGREEQRLADEAAAVAIDETPVAAPPVAAPVE